MTQENIDLNSVVIATNKWMYSPDNVTLLQWVARYAGLPETAIPRCTDNITGTYAEALNDAIPDERMQSLVPFIPMLAHPQPIRPYHVRALLCADRAMRFFAAEALKAAGLNAGTAKLLAAKPIVDEKTTQSAVEVARAAVHAERKTDVSEQAIIALRALDAATRAASASESAAYAATRLEHYEVKAQGKSWDDSASRNARQYRDATYEGSTASASLAIDAAEAAAEIADPTKIWDAALQLLRDLIEVGR